MSDNSITIYHNLQCGTSRNVLAMIRNSGVEPNVVAYLKTPLNAEQLQALVKQLGIPVRDLLRQKGTPYDELGLGEAHWTDAQLIDHIAAHPILMNRPVVVTSKGARLCRPSETVLEILPNAQQGGFTKEDGQVVLPGKAPHA
jgi:arsenate reductase